jgi:hypothetical protein
MNDNNSSLEQSNIEKRSPDQPTATLFCISHIYPPKINPLANRVSKLLSGFQQDWRIIGLTDTENAYLNEEAQVYVVKSWVPQLLIDLFNKLKLSKINDLLVWPDRSIFWVLPALIKGYQIIKKEKPDVILVFLMPYSASLVGVWLKWLTGLPLIFNLNDSISCTDMHAHTPTWLHHRLEMWLEYFYGRHADALVYVSEVNLELAQKRQAPEHQAKFHLIRCGIDPRDYANPVTLNERKNQGDNQENNQENFNIIYTGGMNGWYEFLKQEQGKSSIKSFLKNLYRQWQEWGRYYRAQVDYRSSSPVFIGKAMQSVLAENPLWQDKLHLKIYGNTFLDDVVKQVLDKYELSPLVEVFGRTKHSEVIQIARQADLLLLTLPDRPDGDAGGRISVKTYEYLMTDRPILAAIPKGENWNYLHDKPGVWIVNPTDTNAMSAVINEVMAAKMAGTPLRFDRTAIQQEMSYTKLTQDFLKVLAPFHK